MLIADNFTALPNKMDIIYDIKVARIGTTFMEPFTATAHCSTIIILYPIQYLKKY